LSNGGGDDLVMHVILSDVIFKNSSLLEHLTHINES